MEQIIRLLGKNGSSPVRYRDIGLTKAKLNLLQKMGLIEFTKLPTKTGKPSKTFNAVKLTSKGLLFYDLIVSEKKMNVSMEIRRLQEELARIDNRMDKVVEEIGYLKEELSEINSSLKDLFVSFSSKKEISEEEFLKHLKNAYNHFKGRVTPVASLAKVVNELEKELSLSRNEIEKQILELYNKGIISLEPGKGENYVINDYEGNKYAYIKV